MALQSRAVPNSGSVLFGRIRIIDAIIRPTMNRIRIVELWISVIVIGYIIVDIIIIILSGSSSPIRPMYKSENTKTTLKLKMKSVFRPTSETSLQFHMKFALRKTKRSRFSASKHVRLSPAISPVELKRRSWHACRMGRQVTSSGVTEKRKPGRVVTPPGEWIWCSRLAWCSQVLDQLSFDLVSERWEIGLLPLLMMCVHVVSWRPKVHVRV